MANTVTLTGLTEILYQARDRVARELTGFIPSVTVNSGSEGVSLGGTVSSTVTAQPTLNTDHTPAMTVPAGDDTTVTTETVTIGQKSRTNIPILGEIAKQLNNTADYGLVLEQLFAQHIRTHVNAIEAHCGTVIKNGSSRAVGTAGTTPFASAHGLIVDAHQILKDNGCPEDGQISLVANTSAGSNLRKLSNIYKANESGSSDTFRRGVLLDIDGVAIRESAQVPSHTKGTLASSPTSAAAGFALGATSVTLTASVGTGTILQGDALSIANDTGNVYIVGTGVADASTAATLVLNKPGLRKATGASTRALTLAATYTGNTMFHRSAVELVMRPPAMPPGGDAAAERMTVFDPISGLTFEVAIYNGYGMNMIEFVCYYQAKVWKQEFVSTILG